MNTPVPSARPLAAPRPLALFDLDGTLTHHDTCLPFLAGYLVRHPRRLLRLWRLVPAVVRYVLAGRDRGLLKSRAIRAAMGGAARPLVEAWAQQFVANLHSKGAFRMAGLAVLEAHRSAGDHLVLLSASPDLYVPLIGRMLRFERTVCTGIRWDGERLDGALRTANRRGEEKVRCLERLREEYAPATVTAYGNSLSDIAHLERADRAVLVNGNRAARHGAARVGIPTAHWP